MTGPVSLPAGKMGTRLVLAPLMHGQRRAGCSQATQHSGSSRLPPVSQQPHQMSGNCRALNAHEAGSTQHALATVLCCLRGCRMARVQLSQTASPHAWGLG